MKRILFVLALSLGLFPPFGTPVKAETGIPATIDIRNTATVPLFTAYNVVGSSLFNKTLAGKANIAIYNKTAAEIAIGTMSDVCNGATVDSFVIPANSGLVVERVAVKKSICVRSVTGSSVGSGSIYSSAW